MKGVLKGLIIGLIVIAFGVAILIGGLAINGWRISTNIEFETMTYTAENVSSAVKLNINAGSVVTEFYDGDKITVEYPYAREYVTTISERNGAITVTNKLKWYMMFGSVNIPQTVIKLPQGVTYDLSVDMDAGTANIADGTYGAVSVSVDAGTFKAGSIASNSFKCDLDAGTVNVSSLQCDILDCEIDAGTVKINSLTCPDSRIDVDAGSVSLGFTGAQSEYTISRRVSAGSCNVQAQTGSTDKKISVEVDAGLVKLSFGV